MSYKLSRAREFVTDIDEVFVYIGVDNIEAAVRFVDAVDATLILIASQPFAGFERDFRNDRLGPVRFWPVKGFDKYLIGYLPHRDSKTVHAIRVVNTYRDLSTIFADED